MATIAALLVTLTAAGCADVIEHDVANGRAGKFDAALRDACASGEIVPATSLIPEKWDRMLVVMEGTYGYMVNDTLGFHYTHDDSYFGASYTGILLDGEKKVVEIDYSFGTNNPPVEMPAPGQIFDADTLRVTPRSETPESMQKWLERRHQDCILLSPDDAEAFNY
ncbi:hypothetical protein ACFWHR_09620 [Leucobacter sp. NPDC058333]|uniref:hypothetical protein n=1 Tax=Leucobacter sp. NPDC058333 TaxID=3346450 RepID=UPI00364AC89B